MCARPSAAPARRASRWRAAVSPRRSEGVDSGKSGRPVKIFGVLSLQSRALHDRRRSGANRALKIVCGPERQLPERGASPSRQRYSMGLRQHGCDR